MANMENTTGWKQIQQGLRDTERLIGRKEYNMAMIKARQTLEFMVRCMAERACVVEGDLSDTIDQLYEGRWISRSTKEHYHNIRVLGNKAVHEGDDTPYDANQAYQLLAQEVVAFAEEYRGGAKGPQPRSTGGRRPASGQRRPGTGKKKKRRKSIPPAYYILRLLVPVLAVVLLILVIRAMMPGEEGKDKTQTTAAQTTEQASEPPTETAPEATETEPQAADNSTYVVTGTGVNVRTEPSTSGRVLVQLSAGDTVEYVKRYNSDWTVINYEGQEAYISSQYISKQEPQAAEADGEEAAPQE